MVARWTEACGGQLAEVPSKWWCDAARPDCGAHHHRCGLDLPSPLTGALGAGPRVSSAAAAGGTVVFGGGEIEPLVPARLLDTRNGNGAPVGKVGPGSTSILRVAGRGGVPAIGAGAVVLNVVATEPTANGGTGFGSASYSLTPYSGQLLPPIADGLWANFAVDVGSYQPEAGYPLFGETYRCPGTSAGVGPLGSETPVLLPAFAPVPQADPAFGGVDKLEADYSWQVDGFYTRTVRIRLSRSLIDINGNGIPDDIE